MLKQIKKYINASESNHFSVPLLMRKFHISYEMAVYYLTVLSKQAWKVKRNEKGEVQGLEF